MTDRLHRAALASPDVCRIWGGLPMPNCASKRLHFVEMVGL